MAEPTPSVEALKASLDPLEAALAPLLDRPLDDTLSSLEPLQQAKLLVMLGYLTHDLSWIYLKTRGITPADHAVTPELDRIKSFFAKLKPYSDPTASTSGQRTSKLDKAAASRFLKHAVASATSSEKARVPGDHTVVSGDVKLPEIRQVVKGKHKRFEGDEEESSSDEEKELQVFDQSVGETPKTPEKKKKKKAKTDALQGYDRSGASTPATGSDKETNKKKKKRKKDGANTASAPLSPAS